MKFLEGVRFFHGRMNLVRKGMAQKFRVHASRPVQIFFKRKDHKHTVDRLSNLLDAPFAPGPDLRADKIKNRDVCLLAQPGEAKVQGGVVDEDGGGVLTRCNFPGKRAVNF